MRGRQNSGGGYQKSPQDPVYQKELTEISGQQSATTRALSRGQVDANYNSGMTRRTSTSKTSSSISQYTELPEPKSIDNFLSNTQKNFKSEQTASTYQGIEGTSLITQQPVKEDKKRIFQIRTANLQSSKDESNEESSKIFSVRFDQKDEMIATASEDGVVRIISVGKGTVMYNLVDFSEKSQPATCVRWRPETSQSSIKNTLLATYSDGKSLLWHATSQQILARYSEPKNDINTCDFTPDGKQFITAGLDSKVRMYEVGRKVPTVFTKGTCSEHKNRIYASKFIDQNTLLTAGWDANVMIWDIRTQKTQGYIHGPMICGDSLDEKEGIILTGSWRSDKQLQLWDIRNTNKVMEDIKWENEVSDDLRQQSFIYSCQFSKINNNYIIAGSTITYELRLFDRQLNNTCIETFQENITKGVLSLDWGNTSSKLTFGTSNSQWALTNVY